MSTPPLVSVVMAVYNGEPYLREAIDSVLGQTFGDFEFIIVNDGSTDGTEDTIRGYSDPRVRLTTQTNHGFSYSLNLGIQLARGTYIARMDADDISAPERFAMQVQLLTSQPQIAVLGTSIVRINQMGRPLRTEYYLAHDSELRQDLTVQCPFAHGSVMMRKDLVQKVGGYRQEFWPAEDYDLWRRMAAAGELANRLEPLYLYRDNSNGMSSTHESRMLNMAILISGQLLADRGCQRDIPLRRCLASYDSAPKDARAAAIARIVENYFRVLSACARRGRVLSATYRFGKLALSGQAGFEFVATKLASKLRVAASPLRRRSRT